MDRRKNPATSLGSGDSKPWSLVPGERLDSRSGSEYRVTLRAQPSLTQCFPLRGLCEAVGPGPSSEPRREAAEGFSDHRAGWHGSHRPHCLHVHGKVS